jgi:hypothetical protein
MGAVKVGDPMSPHTELGPLSSESQLNLILGQIAEAKRTGARLLVGGEKLEAAGAFLKAGVLVDVPIGIEIRRRRLEFAGRLAIALQSKDLAKYEPLSWHAVLEREPSCKLNLSRVVDLSVNDPESSRAILRSWISELYAIV